MKMKKFLTGFTVLAMSTLLLAACGGNKDSKETKKETKTEETSKKEEKEATPAKIEKEAGGDLQDGTYKLEEKNLDDNGWKVSFEMTVKDGVITESNYDYLDKDGKKKSENKEYQDMMKEKAGTGPADFIPELNDAFVKAQTADGVEVVTGATHSSDAFKNYAQQLVQAAQAGKTDTIEIDNGAKMKDGSYTLEEKNDSNGYHATFTLVVKGGKITESKYDNVNAEGKSKVDDKKYNEMMKKDAGTSPDEFIKKLNDALVEKGNPADVEVVTGATHSTHSFQTYALQLVNAAEKGATDKIVVDNIVLKQ